MLMAKTLVGISTTLLRSGDTGGDRRAVYAHRGSPRTHRGVSRRTRRTSAGPSGCRDVVWREEGGFVDSTSHTKYSVDRQMPILWARGRIEATGFGSRKLIRGNTPSSER